MSARIKIRDGEGSRREAGVTQDYALKVTTVDESAAFIPPEVLTRRKVFYEFMRDASNSRDMHLADGSVTPVEFNMEATAGRVRWVSRIRFIIEGNNFDLSASGDFRRWGSVAIAPGLTNGIELFVEQSGVITEIFLDPVQTMGDLFHYQDGYENFVNAVDAQADYLSVDFHMPADVSLPLGVTDKISCKINDDMVSADFLKFQAIVNGYQELVT